VGRENALLRCLLAGVLFACVVVSFAGCNKIMEEVLYGEKPVDGVSTSMLESTYYEAFFVRVTKMNFQGKNEGTDILPALAALPHDTYGEVNWTLAVMEGYLNPKGSLVPGAEEEKPLELNIFIEAKTPLMSNVIFPHSVHTYWLSCANCHPAIFLPEAGANPITMDEIFAGKWCGRCHGTVAFPPGYQYNPKANCIRCHVIPKQMSRERESW
jgi:c(7)-type cytochrome triheme protein